MRVNATDLWLPQQLEQPEHWWRKLQWQSTWHRQKTIVSIFRLAAFGAGILQVLAFPQIPGYDAANLTIILMLGGIYTSLKIAQPFQWYQIRGINFCILAVDMLVSALLAHFTGGLHTPFVLYTLVPVLTSAVLKDYRVTVFVSAITAAYVLAGYIYNPASNYVPTAQAFNDFLIYMVALGLVASLPYAVNLCLGHRLQSQAATAERRRISRELHDGVCQTLCGLRWQVRSLSDCVSVDSQLSHECQTIEKSLDAAERDARGLLEVLRSLGDRERFLPNIRHYLEHLKHYSGINYQLEYGDTNVELAEAIELESTMICVEALANIKKHAGAKNVIFNVRRVNGHIQIKITDDGCGFDYPGKLDHKGHGLAIMRERAESIGGTLQIKSAIGRGTEILVELPRRQSEAIWQP